MLDLTDIQMTFMLDHGFRADSLKSSCFCFMIGLICKLPCRREGQSLLPISPSPPPPSRKEEAGKDWMPPVLQRVFLQITIIITIRKERAKRKATNDKTKVDDILSR